MKDVDADLPSVSEKESGSLKLDSERSPLRQKYRGPVLSPRTKRLVKASKVDKSDKKFLKPAVVCLGKKVKLKRSAMSTPTKHSRCKDLGKKKLLRMCGKIKMNAKVRMKMKNREGEESSALLHRPKRMVKMPRSLEYTAALSRKEEQELKKALYASLLETKKSEHGEGMVPGSYEMTRSVMQGAIAGHFLGKKLKKSGLKLMMPPAALCDSGQDSNRSSAASTVSSVSQDRKSIVPRPVPVGGSKSPLRAQRKFAEGSRPCSPISASSTANNSASSSPSKPISKPQSGTSTPRKPLNPNRKAKTEDFLTFLCLRGSHFLPPHLEFFNYCEAESLPSFPGTPRQSQDGSRPATPLSSSISTLGGGADTPRNGRSGSVRDAASRASSPDREIQIDNSELGVRPLVAAGSGKKCAVGVAPFRTALRVMGASSSPSSSRALATRSKPISASSSSTLQLPPTTTSTTTVSLPQSPLSISQSPSSASTSALKMRASPSYQTRQSAKLAADTTLLDGGGSGGCPTSNNPTPTSEESEATSKETVSDDGTDVEQERPKSLKLEVSTQTPYPCIDDLPDIVDSTPEDDSTQDSDDSQQCLDMVPYGDPSQVVHCADMNTVYPSYGASAYGMSMPMVQPMGPASNVPINLSLNFGEASLGIPAGSMPLGPPLDLGPPMGGNGGTLVAPNIAGMSTNYVVQCQSAVMQPTGLMVTSVPNFRCPTFLSTSQTLIAAETGLTLLPCQPHNQLPTIPNMNPTLSISILPQTPGITTRSGSGVGVGRPIAPAPADGSTGGSPLRPQPMTSPSRTPAKVKGSKSSSSSSKDRTKSAKVVDKQMKKLQAVGKKLLQHGKLLKAPKVKGRGHTEGQGVIEVDDEIEIVMPEKRSLGGRQPRTSGKNGSSVGNEARKRLIRKAKSQASRASERRRLRSDTRREQDYELAVAQGCVGDSDVEVVLDSAAGGSHKKRSKQVTKEHRDRKKKKSKSKSETPSKGKSRKSVKDLLQEAQSPILIPDSPIRIDSTPEKSPPKSAEKAGKGPKKRSHSAEPPSGKKLKSHSSAEKASSSDSGKRKHRKSETVPVAMSMQPPVATTSGGSSRRSRERSIERHRRDHQPAISSPAERTAKVLKSPSSKKSQSKSQPHPPASSRRSSDPIIITGAVREPFPDPTEPARTMDMPTYHPSPEQFQDPISYIESIQVDAESFGICCIVPPDGWKPECEISVDLRFTTQIQHINKMQDRWGSNVFQLECIKKHLESQDNHFECIPLIGGVELDLPMLAEAIRLCGGLQSVIDRNKWLKVADQLRIPKTAQDRTARLYDAYCKYLLSYDTLNEAEKARIESQVHADQETRSQVWDQGCVSRGKSKTLSDFFRVARNTFSIYFPNEQPTVDQVEEEYWHLVEDKSQHVSIQTGHVDTKLCGSAFPTKKESPYSRHGWNFHILQHNNGSVLKYAGQVSGVTVPTLHIGMLFSTNCLSRNMHLLPYISYLHSGADIIWYAIPKSEEDKLKKVLEEIVPDLINPDEPLWLPEDSVMVCPKMLQERGISMCRKVQRQGEFMVVLPQTFTATISTGYNIGESIHFATVDWLPLGVQAAKLLQDSGEPEMFSMDRLYSNLSRSEKASTEQLRVVLPYLQALVDKELRLRKKLKESGLKMGGRMATVENMSPMGKRRHQQCYEALEDEENRCEAFKRICYLSKVVSDHDEAVHCLESVAMSGLTKKQLRHSKLMYRFDEAELKAILRNVQDRLASVAPPPPKKKGPRLKRASHPL